MRTAREWRIEVRTEFSNRVRNAALPGVLVLMAAFCGACSVSADSMAVEFAAQQTFATGSVPSCVTLADVNSDGKFDLVVANAGDETISVMLNATAPGATTISFAAQQTFAVGPSPDSVAVADVNGDGKPDLIAANYYNSISVLLNTTAPDATTSSFAAQQTFFTVTGLYSITVADVNGDGKPDAIVTNYDSSAVSVLLDTTTTGSDIASFTAEQMFATGENPASVTAADVNGDGKPDLIVANSWSDTVSVLLNEAAAGATVPVFATQQTFDTGNDARSVVMSDINGDGKPDLIVANTNDNTTSVLLNTTEPGATSASFAAQQTFPTDKEQPISVIAVDVNDDGAPDLMTANINGSTVSALVNTTVAGASTPSFAIQQTFAVGGSPVSIAGGDVNGDGKPDLVVANHDDNTVSVLVNTEAMEDHIFNDGFD